MITECQGNLLAQKSTFCEGKTKSNKVLTMKIWYQEIIYSILHFKNVKDTLKISR